jgi:stage V sporulation protein R
MRNTKLPPELQTAWEAIEGYANEYGLDTFPISFEVVDYRTLYEIAAFGGFPTRYPHWRWGMEFDQLIKGHTYGLSIIYELVINNNPSYAYLLEGNDIATQKMVMAHVAGHVDFFKNNFWFSHTNRHMLDTMANHAVRIGNLIDRVGYEQVENFIDVCLSLDNLIDYHAPYIRRPESQTPVPITEDDEDEEETVSGLPVDRAYMKGYINPPEFLEEQRKRLTEEQNRLRKFPENPQRDVLLFLLAFAPLERWQRTILEIIRDEAYYFAPQMMTKILNEGWACLTAGSLLVTEHGLLPIEEIVERRLPIAVSDGETPRAIYDWAKFEDRATVRVRTRRGFEVEGSATHRLLLPDGTWRRMDELVLGDEVALGAGPDLWPSAYVALDWTPPRRMTLEHVASAANVNLSTVIRYRNGMRGRHSAHLAPLVADYDRGVAVLGMSQDVRRLPIRIPTVVDEDLAAFLGYLVGDGHISERKRVIGLTTGDEEQAERFAALAKQLFGLRASRCWDEGRWRVNLHSRDVENFLKHLGLRTGVAARIKDVPQAILRSPRSVVAAFLRAYFDCDGYTGDMGVILSTASTRLAQTTQLLLLNFGILSTRRQQADGCWHVHITGTSAKVYVEQIGFGLARKQEALRRYVEDRHFFKREGWRDTVVAIEHGRADVYDISVGHTHRYAAQGFVNHNSYWHSEIMTKKAADPSEIVDFADHHSGVVATSPGRLNPYKLGLELLRDIEERWDKGRFGKEWEECDDLEAKRNWNRPTNLGRQKIFEVRRFHNDITFIDEFLTPEFALEQKLFTFQYNRDTDLYEIASREFAEIKQKLLYRLTNFGQPFIYVAEGNYGNRGDLYLQHRHEGVDLRLDYARDTLRNIQHIWKRPVFLETIFDDKKRLLGYDGRDYSDRRID